MAFENPYPSARGPLTTALVSLAGTPEYKSTIDSQLATIAQLAAARVGSAEYASITGTRNQAPVTVAVSDEFIRSIDDVQHADNDGPCVEALRSATPIGVPDIDATMRWPRFHEEAPRLGLHASVSVPLHTGRGEPIAVLNVFGRDRAAMAPLIAAVLAVRGEPLEGATPLTDAGGMELVAGYAESLLVRDRIGRATDLIMRENSCGPDDAYVILCIRAAQNATDLAAAATTFLFPGNF
jgi:hypothetical protein